MRIMPSACHHREQKFVSAATPQVASFTEQQILALQQQLLNPGFHHLTVPTIEDGRALMLSFLSSLGCYDQVASISLGPVGLPENIQDIFHLLACGRYLDLPDGISSFLVDFWPMDFLWIEESDELMSQEWYTSVKRVLSEFHYDQHIPIMVLSYNVNEAIAP